MPSPTFSLTLTPAKPGAPGRLWPPRRGKKPLLGPISPVEFLTQQESALLAALNSPSPLSLDALAAAIAYPSKASLTPLETHLNNLVLAGQCHLWPGRKPCYWSQGPEVLVRRLCSAALLTPAKLAAALKKAGVAHPQSLLDRLLAAGELKPFAPDPKKPRSTALLLVDSPAPFLASVAALLERLQAAGVPPATLRAALLDLAPQDLPALVYAALRRLEPQPLAHFSLTQLRAAPELASLSKSAFDHACQTLWQQQRVFLHHHDRAHLLPPEQRDNLVTFDQVTYYIGISWRPV